MKVLCIFWTHVFISYTNYKYFLLVCSLSFHPCNSIFWKASSKIWWINWLTFSFMDHTFGVMSSSRNLYLTQVHKDILLCFCLQVCSFKFRSMICFELVFFNMMWDMGSLFSNMRYPTASETFDENAKLSPPHCFCTHVENSCSSMCGCISEFSILFYQCACRSLSQYLTVKQRCCWKEKIKRQTNIPHEYRFRHTKRNFNKSKPIIYKKDNMSWRSRVCLRNACFV